MSLAAHVTCACRHSAAAAVVLASPCITRGNCRQRQATAPLRQRISAGATERSADSAEDSGPPEFTEDLTRDSRGSDEDWIQRRQKELQQDRQSWRESLNFQPESLNGSGTARQASLGEKIKEGFDKVLIADFFFVCLSLVALVIATGVQTFSKSTVLSSLWLAAWPVLFQPAIGVLMGGALLSGLIGWVQSDIIKD